MDFAGRLDKYPNIKTNFVPKVGAKWTVNDSLAFRGSYSEGFRAPAVSQIAPGGAQYFLNNTVDPIRCPNGTNPVPGADTADCAKSISGVGGANPDLKPETSKSYSLGFILSPTKNFDMTFDLFRIRKEGEIVLGSATFLLEHPSSYPADYITRDTNPLNQLKDANGNPIPGTGPLLAVKTPWVNQGSTDTSGIDLDMKLRTNLGDYGNLKTSLNTTYIISYRRAEKPGDLERNAVGTNGGLNDWATTVGDIPRLRASCRQVGKKDRITSSLPRALLTVSRKCVVTTTRQRILLHTAILVLANLNQQPAWAAYRSTTLITQIVRYLAGQHLTLVTPTLALRTWSWASTSQIS